MTDKPGGSPPVAWYQPERMAGTQANFLVYASTTLFAKQELLARLKPKLQPELHARLTQQLLAKPELLAVHEPSLFAELKARLIEQLNAELSDTEPAWKIVDGLPDAPKQPVVVMPFDLVHQVPDAGTPPTPHGALRALERKGLLSPHDLMIGPAPADKGSALTRGDLGRVPVAVVAARPPRRRPLESIPGRRRPVVALLDTGMWEHEWLKPDEPGDPFGMDAADTETVGPWTPGPRAPRPEDPKATTLGKYTGHGTFSAGLIRQVAPDARVLTMRLMHEDGQVYEDDLLNALGWLRYRVEQREMASFVDVVCLSLSYEETEAEHATYTAWLGQVIGDLGNLGVRVVVSAGNNGTDTQTYPAALTIAKNQPVTPLVSVGALNPNGTTWAFYSNYGEWVSDWVVGTSVVSTFPRVNGNANPEFSPERDGPRASVDPDDFTSGFARWSGTSFAAASFAGSLAQALVTNALNGRSDPLDDLSPEAAHRRAAAAYKSVGRPAKSDP